MILHVLCNEEGLVGIYDSPEKAVKAAEGYIKSWPDNGRGGKWTKEEQEGEINWYNDRYRLNIERWEMNKALVRGEWKVL